MFRLSLLKIRPMDFHKTLGEQVVDSSASVVKKETVWVFVVK